LAVSADRDYNVALNECPTRLVGYLYARQRPPAPWARHGPDFTVAEEQHRLVLWPSNGLST
jgi:hypothetical protein